MIRPRVCIAIPAVWWVVLGCGPNVIDRPPPPTAPQTIEADGQSWSRVASIGERDEQLLHRHFRRNSALAENSIFAGEPMLYRTRDGRRRFYWLSWLESDVVWLHLEFDDRGRFVGMREGTGAPF